MNAISNGPRIRNGEIPELSADFGSGNAGLGSMLAVEVVPLFSAVVSGLSVVKGGAVVSFLSEVVSGDGSGVRVGGSVVSPEDGCIEGNEKEGDIDGSNVTWVELGGEEVSGVVSGKVVFVLGSGSNDVVVEGDTEG